VTGAGSARPHVYLTDFGLARRDGSSTALTTTGQWMGTPDYAAPEQIDGHELDARTDVYALGCVLFAALTGRPPFGERPRMAKAGAHLHEPPPTLRSLAPGVPLAFEPVVARALAKPPADRFSTAGELGAAALAAARVPGATARTRRLRRTFSGVSRPTARLASAPRRRRLLPLAALLAVLAGIGFAAALGAFSSERKPAPKAIHPPPPPALPVANPVGGTVRCSGTSCVQAGGKVEPPIEGAPCAPGGHAGEWQRIDADGEEPLFACVPSATPPAPPLATEPDLTGARLDHAERMLDRFGVNHDTSGGGTFGILDSGNWTVCASTPPAGSPLSPDTTVRLFVESSC